MSDLKDKKKPRIYGLTGGIASGKSAVALAFRELGIPVLDADQIARDLRAPGGEARPHIEARFQTSDPKLLKQMIFNDPKAKRDIEQILHPLIQKWSADWFASQNPNSPYMIYEAALLIEVGRHQELDGLIVVVSDEENQIQRVMLRDSLDETLSRQIIGSQLPISEKIKHATHLITNHGSLEDLKNQVQSLDIHLRSLA
jgi:dephospho-CoA kinase